MALTYEAFMELTKPNVCQLHLEIYRRLEEREAHPGSGDRTSSETCVGRI